MKKILFTFIASGILTANAQDMLSKKGIPILPEAGNWSIGIDATPFIDWAADKTRIFSNTSVTSASGAISAQTPLTLVLLKVHNASTAYRFKLRIGFSSSTLDNPVRDDAANPTPATVTDEFQTTGSNIGVGFGIQKSAGKGRLHGIYGAEFAVTLANADSTYSYGNAYTARNQSPTSTLPADWLAGQVNGLYAVSYPLSRPTENKSGSVLNFGLDWFIGVEYFFAPKMSFSAEYNYGLFINTLGAGTNTIESGNGTTSTITSTNIGKTSDMHIGVTDVGMIVLHFYF